MTERQDVAAAPAPFPGAGGPYPAAPGQVIPAAQLPGGNEQPAPASQGPAGPASAPTGSSGPAVSSGPAASAGSAARGGQPWAFGQASRTAPGPQAGRGTGQPVPASAEPDDEPHVRVDSRKLEAALLGLRKPLTR